MADETPVTPAPVDPVPTPSKAASVFAKVKSGSEWVLAKIGAAPWWTVPVAVVALLVFHF